MCQQCQGFDDDDDIDALAHAFVLRHGKAEPAKPAPQNQHHALLNRQGAPQAAPAAKKVAR